MDISALRERGGRDSFTVSELNNYIKTVFEDNRILSSVTVRGEISNFTNHRSGHLYFSLKDSEGQIRAVMFRSRAMSLKFMPESGMKVIVHGSVTVYPRDGSYQIYVNSMQPDGIGALYLAYEQLKARLEAEGLFDDEHKTPIPMYPRRIGVITSPTGAAVRDIINVTGRRYPGADLFLYPALVQGEGAEQSLIRALDYLDKTRLCDVIIIGRGGGSIEDLWAFNSEALARRIYEAEVPVISAVGHETDFTICDFVADMRAPTPSAAAELAVPDKKELLIRLDNLNERLYNALLSRTQKARERLDALKERADARAVLSIIERHRQTVLGYYDMARIYADGVLSKHREAFATQVAKVNELNPLSVLSRGYSVAEGENGLIKSIDDVKTDEDVRIVLHDGTFRARVLDVNKGD